MGGNNCCAVREHDTGSQYQTATPGGDQFRTEHRPRFTNNGSGIDEIHDFVNEYAIDRLNLNTMGGLMESYLCSSKGLKNKNKLVYCMDYGNSIDERTRLQIQNT